MTEEMIGPGGEPTGLPPIPSRARMDLRDWFAIALIAAATTRIVASVIAGTIEAVRDSQDRFGSGGKTHAGEVVLGFARFGDGVGALIMAALVGVLYWRVQARKHWYAGRHLALVGMALALLTAAAAVAEVIGYALYLSDQQRIAASMTSIVGEGIAFTIISIAAAIAMYRVTWPIDEQIVSTLPPPEQPRRQETT